MATSRPIRPIARKASRRRPRLMTIAMAASEMAVRSARQKRIVGGASRMDRMMRESGLRTRTPAKASARPMRCADADRRAGCPGFSADRVAAVGVVNGPRGNGGKSSWATPEESIIDPSYYRTADGRRPRSARRSMNPRILVPQPIHEEGLRLLREVGDVEVVETDRMLSRDELKAALRRTDYFLSIGDLPLDADILDANPELKGISAVAGHPEEWMDVDAATARGIPVTGLTRGPVLKTTADLTIALLLGLAWRLIEADLYRRGGRFRQEQSTLFMGHSLEGKTLGLVGLGGVGQAVARRARAFELELVYTKRERASPSLEEELGATWIPELDDLLRRSDFVS